MAIPGMSGATPMDPMGPSTPIGQGPEAANSPLPLVSEQPPENANGQTPPQKKAEQSLKQQITNGTASYSEAGLGTYIGQAIDHQRFGDQVYLTGFEKGTTLGDIEKQYNLPKNSLKHMYTKSKIGYKSEEAPSVVYVTASNVAEGMGKTTKELKAMFPDNLISPWYDPTEKF